MAIVIASPIARYVISSWWEDCAYRIDIQWWVFVMAGLVSVMIALFTLSWQIIRVVVANPVESLRNE